MRESDRMRSVTGAYIDTKAPALAKINTIVNANNAKIKEMTGSTDADNSDTHLGIGDSIEYELMFSEVLDIAEGENTGFTATTNLNDANGNAVTLTSETVSKGQPDNNAYGRGPSDGNVTYIDMGTLTITEGMECTDTDGIIRIKSVSSGSITDLADNALAVSEDDVSALNTADLYVDVISPEISTMLTQTEEVYSIVPYEDGFYFPFEITDDSSGTTGLQASFRWIEGEGSVFGSEYHYALTSSADVPDEWQTESVDYGGSFDVTGETQYLHIKQVDKRRYELMGTTIRMTATDYAGNSISKDFKIDALWDNTYPYAMPGEVTRALADDGSGNGTLTIKVTLTEATALNEAYYAWTDDAVQPDPENITNVPAGDIYGKTEAEVTITETVPDGEDFNKYLWVKVSDKNGNEVVRNLGRQRYDLGMINYTVDKSDDYNCILWFRFYTNDPNGFLLALHPVPGTNNQYYACSEGHYTSNADNWYKVSSETDSEGIRTFTVLEKTGLDDEYLKYHLLQNFEQEDTGGFIESENFGYRNGDYVFYIISGVKDAFIFDDTNTYVKQVGTDAYNVTEESHTLRVTTPILEGRKSIFDGTSVTTADHIPDRQTSYYYYTDDTILSTLEGLTFNIDLGVDTMNWNYEAFDLDNSYLRVWAMGDNTNLYYKEYKLPSRERYQSITLAEDDYPTGEYTVTLFLYDHGTLIDSAALGRDIYIDSRAAPEKDEFGIENLRLECDPVNSGGNYNTGITAVDAYMNESNDTIYMPTSNTPESGSSYEVGEDINKMYVYGSVSMEYVTYNLYLNTNLLIWNETAGQTEELAAINCGPGIGVTVNLYDSKEAAAEYVASIDTVDPGKVAQAPLCMIKNEVNVIAVRAVLANGKKSDVKYYSIYPSWFEMNGTVRTQVNEDGGVLRNDNEIIYTPAEGESMEGIRIYLTCQSGKKELTAQPDGTYRCQIEPGYQHNRLYATNEYGSIVYIGDYAAWDNIRRWYVGNNYIFTLRDNEAPQITYTESQIDGGNYTVKFRIDDLSFVDFEDDSPINLKLLFDGTYSERLGLEEQTQSQDDGQSQAVFELSMDKFEEVTEDGKVTYKEFIWEADDISNTGIYRVEAKRPKEMYVGTENYMEVTVYGVAKYLESEAEGMAIPITLTAEATDKFGYTGTATFDAISPLNTKPAVVNDGTAQPAYEPTYDGSFDRWLVLPFNTVVQPEASWILPEPEGYQTEWKDGFPITKDGTTEITFYDIFGTPYTEALTLENVFGVYGVDLNISPETYTKETIMLSASIVNKDSVAKLRFWVEDDYGIDTGVGYPLKEASYEVNFNGRVGIYVYTEIFDEDYGDKLTIHIDNFVSGAPEAEPRFYLDQYGEEYTEAELIEKFPAGLETTGNVDVWYKTSRYVQPIDDTGERVRFTYKDTDTTHTFKYVDEFGNEGSLDINLADYGITFFSPPEPYVDKSAPTLAVDVYAKLFDNYTASGAFSATTSEADVATEFDNIGYVQGYSMKIKVSDYSSYKIVVLDSPPASLSYSGAASDTIEGVSISGNTITISKDIAKDFTVAVVDNANAETGAGSDNFSYVTIKREDLINWFDTTPPTAKHQIVPNGLYEQIAYVQFSDTADDGTVTSDEENSTVSILNGVLEVETTGTYAGWYKRVFTENTSDEILYRDHVGNMGEKITVEASGIDTDPPSFTVTWTPPYISDSGEVDNYRYPDKAVNTSVYAHIAADKAINVESIKTPYFTYDGREWLDVTDGNIEYISNSCASYTANAEGITVCFDENTLMNDDTVEGFGLRFEVTAANGRTGTVDVYLPKTVIDMSPPAVTMSMTELKREGATVPYAVNVKATANEDFNCLNYGSPDKVYNAANPFEFTIRENGTFEYIFVDAAGNRMPQPITIDDIDGTAPKLTISPDPATEDITTEDTVTVTADEACTLTVNQTEYTLTANTPQALTFAANGVYSIIAEDAAGNESVVNIPVGNVDKIPPNIFFDGITLRIRQGSSQAELDAALSSGVTAWEPETQKTIDNWTYDASGVNLNDIGIYKVTYTAADAANNTKTAVRYVSVYDKASPGIYLDGALIEPEGTTVIKAGEHEIRVDNIQEISAGVLEPYTVKISKGILTIGQVKLRRADVLIDSDGKFTITPGFYTVSVITQSRKTFRAILYVEK